MPREQKKSDLRKRKTKKELWQRSREKESRFLRKMYKARKNVEIKGKKRDIHRRLC